MKTTISICLVTSLIFGSVASAHADWERHHHHGHRQPPAHHYNSPRENWAGPAALLALTGLAIGVATYNQANTAPTYPSAHLGTPPDSGNWYYCASSRQYYPHVRYCPEGWQAITPPR